jgi:hypothetical protein
VDGARPGGFTPDLARSGTNDRTTRHRHDGVPACHDPLMATVRRHVLIDAPAERAWAVVSDAGHLDTWFPGLTGCVLDGDVRTITLGSGLPMPERIITNDAIQRRFQYRIEVPLFTHHLGTVDVIALDDDHCLAVYSTDAEPAPLALVIGGATGDALANLKRMCETDDGPTDGSAA